MQVKIIYTMIKLKLRRNHEKIAMFTMGTRGDVHEKGLKVAVRYIEE